MPYLACGYCTAQYSSMSWPSPGQFGLRAKSGDSKWQK